MHETAYKSPRPARETRSLTFTVESHTDLVWRLHQLRARIFVNQLGWPLPVVDRAERDQFDRKDTVYGAVVEDGEPVAGWRMLPTTRPYLLADVFPHLAGGEELPRSPTVWEISRFGVDPTYPQPEACTLELLRLMLRFAVPRGIETIVAVTDTAFERVLRRAGLKLFRYASEVQVIDDARGTIVAGGLHLAEQTQPRFRRLISSLTVTP